MVWPTLYDNRAKKITIIVFIYGEVNGIVVNDSSHVSFLSQYMDFVFILNSLLLG